MIVIMLLFGFLLLPACYMNENLPATPDAATAKPEPTPEPETPTPELTPTPYLGPWYFDVTLEPTPEYLLEYEKAHGSGYSYYDSAVYSPHAYTYSGEETEIDKIAYILGEMYIEDMKKENEYRSFTITKVHDYSAHVYNEQELNDWLDCLEITATGKYLIVENQWICDYSCRFDYSGGISPIGPQTPGSDFYGGLTTDGSGEFHHWIIQKVDEDTYLMRGLPKCMTSEEPPTVYG